MEKIHPPESCSATEPLDLEKYFKEYRAELCNAEFSSANVLENRLEILKTNFNLPLNLNKIKELEDLCTVDKLRVLKENSKLPLKNVPKDHIIPETHPITQEAKVLSTVKFKEEFNTMKEELQVILGSGEICLDNSKNDPSLTKDIKPGSTFIYNILIYLPFNTLQRNKVTPDNIRVQYEIEVLSTNTLLDLANAIKCFSDTFIVKEVPDMQVEFANFQNAKEKYPSRCFFIENVFYNDMSHPNAIDYSEEVRKWAAEKKIGHFGCESMEGVTFGSLKPRLGYGYVYIHQGSCEHVITFSDARLVQNSDCLVSKRYPRLIYIKRYTNYLCFVCSENHSSWMVVNSDRLPVRKAFFCTKCCESYMFLNGEKVGSFELFPFYPSALTKQS